MMERVINRRTWLAGAAGLGLSGALSGPALAGPPSPRDVEAAFDYAFTLYEFAGAFRRATMIPPGTPEEARYNSLRHRRRLSAASDRMVTAPNNDTLYSSAFLELSGGPVEVEAPSVAGRYYSLAFMDAFTDNFALFGSRASGGKGGRIWVAGPDWRGAAPEGVKLIRSSTNDVWMLMRTLVTGPEDVAAANAVQDQLRIVAPAPGRGPIRPLTTPSGLNTDPAAVLALANAMLGRATKQVGQARRARTFRSLGVRAGAVDAFTSLAPEIQALWREVAPRRVEALKARFGRGASVVRGWATPPENLGNFGEDDELRAAVALGGIAALPREEAMYFSSLSDGLGAPIAPGKSYRLRVGLEGVPVDGFWSLTMYAAEPDGRYFFVDNPLNRYALSDRSPGLVRGKDGSIEIALQSEPPAEGERVNWLPAPAGPWRASFRCYAPRQPLLAGAWTPPPLEPV